MLFGEPGVIISIVKEQPFKCDASELEEILKSLEELSDKTIKVVDLVNGKALIQIDKSFYLVDNN